MQELDEREREEFYRSVLLYLIFPQVQILTYLLLLFRLKKVQDRKKRIKAAHDEELRKENIDPEELEHMVGVPNLLEDENDDQIIF